jgi:hypothetical protein
MSDLAVILPQRLPKAIAWAEVRSDKSHYTCRYFKHEPKLLSFDFLRRGTNTNMTRKRLYYASAKMVSI